MFKTAKIAFTLLKWGFKIILFLMETLIWVFYILFQAILKGSDAFKGMKSYKQGKLICPQGHEVLLSGGIYECGSCGFIYQGSILQCANPECRATTPYINCPECGLSVRNPYRWGRP